MVGIDSGCPGLASSLRLQRFVRPLEFMPEHGTVGYLSLACQSLMIRGPALILVLIFMAVSFGSLGWRVLWWGVIPVARGLPVQ